MTKESRKEREVRVQNFSLYETLIGTAKQMGLELRGLGENPLTSAQVQSGSTTFLAPASGMQHWCRVNERILLERDLRDARVFAGFQRMSRVRAVLKRYQGICERAREVWVFAQEDWRPVLPHARLVAIDDIDLCREWFLLIESRRHKALLAARELDDFDPMRPLASRQFEGVSTFDAKLIIAARDAIEDWIASFL
jgi:DICT domain-containing protein